MCSLSLLHNERVEMNSISVTTLDEDIQHFSVVCRRKYEVVDVELDVDTRF